ncbi:MAG: hypothetical protein AB7U43_03955 [Desulfobacter sp.]
MSSYNEELKLKLAWQTAFEQRTCPPAEILYTKSPDEQLKKHLSFCASCRESREIAKDGNIGFQNMFRSITPEVLKPETELNKQPGQIWAMSKSLGRWMDDGRYSSPPAVLLLSNRDDASCWKVAQLYTDRRLMGNDDVWLGDQFGFAQAWNSYTLRQDILDCLLGSVSESVVAEVISVAAAQVKQYEEDSIISFFRELEIAVGANVALQPWTVAAEVVEKKIISLTPGLKLAIGNAKEFVLDITMETLELLRGSFKPALVLRGGPAKPSAARLSVEHKKLIQDHCQVVPVDLKVADDTLQVVLKWLHNRPIHLSSVQSFFNDVAVPSTDIDILNPESISIKHGSTFLLKRSQICRFRVSYINQLLTLDVSSEK